MPPPWTYQSSKDRPRETDQQTAREETKKDPDPEKWLRVFLRSLYVVLALLAWADGFGWAAFGLLAAAVVADALWLRRQSTGSVG